MQLFQRSRALQFYLFAVRKLFVDKGRYLRFSPSISLWLVEGCLRDMSCLSCASNIQLLKCSFSVSLSIIPLLSNHLVLVLSFSTFSRQFVKSIIYAAGLYDARKLTKLVKKLEKYQGDLDLINKHLVAFPHAPRPIVKVNFK